MLFVVEGIDGTGKTTLAKHLANVLPGYTLVVHHGKPQKHPLLEYEGDLLETYVPGDDINQVHDRFHVGETIWPIVFNRKTEYTPEMYFHTQLFLQSRGAVMILCAEDPEILLERLTKRGEDALPLDLTTIENVQNDFVNALTSILPPYLHVISKPHLLNADTMLGLAKAREIRAKRVLKLTSAYVGSHYPHALLVGEKYGGARRGKPDVLLPFVPWPNACGSYLMRAIKDSLLSYGLVNAFVGERPEPLWELWMELGNPSVVALGRNAAKELDRQDVPHSTVPHPQFAKRFHNRDHVRYRSLIEDAVAAGTGDYIEAFTKETTS